MGVYDWESLLAMDGERWGLGLLFRVLDAVCNVCRLYQSYCYYLAGMRTMNGFHQRASFCRARCEVWLHNAVPLLLVTDDEMGWTLLRTQFKIHLYGGWDIEIVEDAQHRCQGGG